MVTIDPHRWAIVLGAIVLVFHWIGRAVVAISRYSWLVFLGIVAMFWACQQSYTCRYSLCALVGIC
jgi:hypothetical protein